MVTNTSYKNRIVGNGTADPKELRANPLNWRKHPELQKKAMHDVLDNVGWIQDVIINKTTGRLIDGHLRVELALKNGETEVPVKYVELSEEEEKTALATFDPISAMAEKDDAAFQKLVATAQEQVKAVPYEAEYVPIGKVEHHDSELAKSIIKQVKREYKIEDDDDDDTEIETEKSEETKYTKKIVTPQYEITGVCPTFDQMYNTDKTESLIDEIKRSGVTAEEKAFLIEAAKRFTVFNFRNIAEYYAHANKEMQQLMERSALVIIDVDDAILNGFVRLQSKLLDLMNTDGTDGTEDADETDETIVR